MTTRTIAICGSWLRQGSLRIEYHTASDGPATKTQDDFVTVDLKRRKLVHFNASDLGRPAAARRIADQ
jgi:hypothetical protein